MNIVLLGAPGSGKGTQAETLTRRLGLTHVATGDLFRQHVNRATPIGLRAKAYMDRGELVPDDITVAILEERLRGPGLEAGVVFDGFPRTRAQAEALDRLMTLLRRRVDVVLYIDVPNDLIVSRLAGRLICRKCQAPFHESARPFTVCPTGECHGEHLYRRDDDRPETVRARLETFHTQTEPLTQYYAESQLLVRVPGEGTPDDVSQATLRAAEAAGRARA
jgi:adenylate kinase